MPRPAPPVFKTWLLFFAPSTLLGHLASLAAVRVLVPDAEAGNSGPLLQAWVVGLVAPVPVSLALFAWIVTQSFEPEPAVRRLPAVRPWLLYYVVSTVVGYVASVFGGAFVGVLILQTGHRIDPEDWRFLLVAVVFFVAPPSWIIFRWVVGRCYVSEPGERPGNENSPG